MLLLKSNWQCFSGIWRTNSEQTGNCRRYDCSVDGVCDGLLCNCRRHNKGRCAERVDVDLSFCDGFVVVVNDCPTGDDVQEYIACRRCVDRLLVLSELLGYGVVDDFVDCICLANARHSAEKLTCAGAQFNDVDVAVFCKFII